MNRERAKLRDEGCSEREERKRVANLRAEFVFVSKEYIGLKKKSIGFCFGKENSVFNSIFYVWDTVLC